MLFSVQLAFTTVRNESCCHHANLLPPEHTKHKVLFPPLYSSHSLFNSEIFIFHATVRAFSPTLFALPNRRNRLIKHLWKGIGETCDISSRQAYAQLHTIIHIWDIIRYIWYVISHFWRESERASMLMRKLYIPSFPPPRNRLSHKSKPASSSEENNPQCDENKC